MTSREQRRHPKKAQDAPSPPEENMRGTGTNQDVTDPRAKNSGHGKKTADKWNQ